MEDEGIEMGGIEIKLAAHSLIPSACPIYFSWCILTMPSAPPNSTACSPSPSVCSSSPAACSSKHLDPHDFRFVRHPSRLSVRHPPMMPGPPVVAGTTRRQ
jgi:hypothetical protein